MVPPDRRGSPTDAGTRLPSPARQIAKVVVEKEHLPFFDVAYQGFASGDLVEDAFAPRLFASKGIEFLCSQSYAKNLGLYGERIGALNAVLNSPEAATKVLSQLKRVARAMYSNPPVHGARIVAEVVNDPAMFKEWNEEPRRDAARGWGGRPSAGQEVPGHSRARGAPAAAGQRARRGEGGDATRRGVT